MAENRLQVLPSRMVLTAMKEKFAAARTGHDLLKKKSDAIKARLQKMLREILELKRRVVGELKDAFFSHTEAVWAAGNFNYLVIENTKEATYRVRGKILNVAGVKLPVFERVSDGTPPRDKDLSMLGLSKGGQSVASSKESFTKTLSDLVMLASLQTSLKTLDQALKVTNRRVNALEFVVMPQLNNTIKYIISELDELEREDQYRIKKVKDIRTRQDDEEAAERAERNERAQARELSGAIQSESAAGAKPANLLEQKNYVADALFDPSND